MSKRREDESRPSASVISQRATLRDVPAAKYKDASVGTVAPRGLRGPSLLPGQGAPERIIPEDVELAVLRDAETLDGPKVARAAASKRVSAESRSTSPMAVSVEVPRARSMPPAYGEYSSTPPSPIARSIQSGTLMSIGSVDPRAPTELSLPSPRPMSVSERAAYLGPEAVVDRTPLNLRRGPPGAGDSRAGDISQRPAPSGAPLPRVNPPSASAGSPSVRPSASLGPSPSVRPPPTRVGPSPSVRSSASVGPSPSVRPASASVGPSPSVRPPFPSVRPPFPSVRPASASVAPPASARPPSASARPTANV